jgi:AraC-like DNA-binding protein
MLENPKDMRDRSLVDADPLTDVLKLTDIRCTLVGRLRAGGSWAVRFPPPRLVKFTAIARGACWLVLGHNGEPLRLEAGDVFKVPTDQPFLLASDLGAEPVDGAELFAQSANGSAQVGEGDDFLSFGGHMAIDRERAGLLIETPPSFFRVDGRLPEASAMRWLLNELTKEVVSDRPGSKLASEQLAQLVFMQMIRSYLADQPPLSFGWAGALRDKRIARSIGLMHREPGRRWRLDDLAKHVGMSRTSFAAGFKSSVGVAPLAYLQEWRMRLAERGLRDGARSLSDLSRSLGYESESAFSNAFKRKRGMAPKLYRSGSVVKDEPT